MHHPIRTILVHTDLNLHQGYTAEKCRANRYCTNLTHKIPLQKSVFPPIPLSGDMDLYGISVLYIQCVRKVAVHLGCGRVQLKCDGIR
jgi:hypothetical protein